MFAASLLLLGVLASTGASAQIKRTPLLTADVAAPGHQALVVRGEIDPGVSAPRDTHPGDEISYVPEREAALLIDREPPRVVKAAEAFVIPAGKVQGARNTGSTPVRFVGYTLSKTASRWRRRRRDLVAGRPAPTIVVPPRQVSD